MRSTTSATINQCPDPRHYLFLVPITAVLAAPVINEFFLFRKFSWIAVLVIACASWAFWNSFENRWFTYFILGALMLIRSFLPSTISVKGQRSFLVATILILFFQPMNDFFYARTTGYEVQKRLIIDYFKNSGKKKCLVISSQVQANYGNYYLAFDTSQVRFVSFRELKNSDLQTGKEIYLLKNGFNEYLSGLSWEDLPPYMKEIPATAEKVFDEKNIVLYKIKDAQALSGMIQ